MFEALGKMLAAPRGDLRSGGTVGGMALSDPALADWFMGGGSWAGAAVTPETAMGVPAVYACVRVLAETVAQLPMVVYRHEGDDKERDSSHPLYDVLHLAPNAEQTSFELREMLMGHASLRGNGYLACPDYNRDGFADELIPLHPARVKSFRTPKKTWAFAYYPLEGPVQIFLEGELLRIPFMALDGVEGKSPITQHRETVGAQLAGREYAARFFSNSAVPLGALEVPQILDAEAAGLLRASWEKQHKGGSRAHRVAVLDGGMKWKEIGMTNDDAQYLEIQKFGVTEIARIFRVPAHKVGDLEKATFSNIEQQAIEFVTDTIAPWIVRLEQRFTRTLLTKENRRTHSIGIELKGLLRGDSQARANFYKALFQMGALSPNDIRRLEDMKKIAGGDRYYVPLNFADTKDHSEVVTRMLPAAANADFEARLLAAVDEKLSTLKLAA